jgi:hypothetical protein
VVVTVAKPPPCRFVAVARCSPGRAVTKIDPFGQVVATHGLSGLRDCSAARVQRDVLFADEGDEGDVLTSAGVVGGLDLCLHLVRRDHGATSPRRSRGGW